MEERRRFEAGGPLPRASGSPATNVEDGDEVREYGEEIWRYEGEGEGIIKDMETGEGGGEREKKDEDKGVFKGITNSLRNAKEKVRWSA